MSIISVVVPRVSAILEFQQCGTNTVARARCKGDPQLKVRVIWLACGSGFKISLCREDRCSRNACNSKFVKKCCGGGRQATTISIVFDFVPSRLEKVKSSNKGEQCRARCKGEPQLKVRGIRLGRASGLKISWYCVKIVFQEKGAIRI